MLEAENPLVVVVLSDMWLFIPVTKVKIWQSPALLLLYIVCCGILLDGNIIKKNLHRSHTTYQMVCSRMFYEILIYSTGSKQYSI